MHDPEEHSVPSLQPSAGPVRSYLPLVANGRSGAVGRTDGSFSAELLTPKEGGQDAAVLSVRGEIDLETAPTLSELLLPVLERGTGAVVVDLSEVPFMDSSGVHFLVDTLRRLQDQGRRLAVTCRGRGQVHRLLAVAGLLDGLSVHRSRESALSDGDELIRAKHGTDRWRQTRGLCDR